MEPQRFITRERECLELPREGAAVETAARGRRQMQPARLSIEVDTRSRCRPVERELQAAQRPAAKLELVQVRGCGGAALRGGIEVDLGIESREGHALVENVRSLGGRLDIGRIEGAADRPRCLQPAAAAGREQTEILGRHTKSQIGCAVDAAIECKSRMAEPHADLLERPSVTRVHELAAAAGGTAAQPPAEAVDLHTERVARLEATPRHLEPKIEAAGQIRPDLPRIDSSRVTADGP